MLKNQFHVKERQNQLFDIYEYRYNCRLVSGCQVKHIMSTDSSHLRKQTRNCYSSELQLRGMSSTHNKKNKLLKMYL